MKESWWAFSRHKLKQNAVLLRLDRGCSLTLLMSAQWIASAADLLGGATAVSMIDCQ